MISRCSNKTGRIYDDWVRLLRSAPPQAAYRITEIVAPRLAQAEEQQVAQRTLALMESFEEDFLSCTKRSLFSHPCYFLRHFLRPPVWVQVHAMLFPVAQYEWGGAIRAYPVSKGLTCDEFASPPIVPLAFQVMGRLRKEAVGLAKEGGQHRLIVFLAEMHTLLNYVHPFAEGNGRTLRCYMGLLAQYFGYYLDWSKVSQAAYYEACRHAFRCEQTPMQNVLRQVLIKVEHG